MRHGVAGLVVVAATATACGGDGARASCPTEGCAVSTIDGVAYTDDELLDIIAPDDAGPWAVVVTAHGKGGDRVTMTELAEAIAGRGAVVFDTTLPDDPPFLETTEHLACAVRFARQAAEEHGGDPQHITLVGHSMGAYTGSLVALAGDQYVDDGCVATEGSAKVDALVGYEGPYDHALTEGYPFDLWMLEQTDPELWSAIDPFQHIGGNPGLVVRLIQGVDDDVTQFDVHPEVTERFGRALAEADYDVEVVMIDGANHGYGRPGLPQWDAIIDATMAVA